MKLQCPYCMNLVEPKPTMPSSPLLLQYVCADCGTRFELEFNNVRYFLEHTP
jgi:hypothetical protein